MRERARAREEKERMYLKELMMMFLNELMMM